MFGRLSGAIGLIIMIGAYLISGTTLASILMLGFIIGYKTSEYEN